jgi:hypothetical protein
MTGLPPKLVKTYQQRAKLFGFLDAAGYLTQGGRFELRALQRLGVRSIEPRDLTPDIYVPKSFRAGQFFS